LLSAVQPGVGNEGSIAIWILTKYKASFQAIEDKPVTPEVLVPFPMTIVKTPSSVETTLKDSA
jgi:hypothetical protein